jgi:hypothetical protein
VTELSDSYVDLAVIRFTPDAGLIAFQTDASVAA